jgi:hypothetical protein
MQNKLTWPVINLADFNIGLVTDFAGSTYAIEVEKGDRIFRGQKNHQEICDCLALSGDQATRAAALLFAALSGADYEFSNNEVVISARCKSNTHWSLALSEIADWRALRTRLVELEAELVRQREKFRRIKPHTLILDGKGGLALPNINILPHSIEVHPIEGTVFLQLTVQWDVPCAGQKIDFVIKSRNGSAIITAQPINIWPDQPARLTHVYTAHAVIDSPLDAVLEVYYRGPSQFKYHFLKLIQTHH